MTAPAPTGPRPDTDHSGSRSRRRVVRTAVALLLLLLALGVVDRVAAGLAARRLATNVQTAQGLAQRPDVRIRGFPFLTQLVAGQYREVDVSTTGPVSRQGVEVAHAQASLRGVRVSASEALRGTVREVPVASGSGSALLTYPELTAVLARYAGPVGAAVTVTGTPDGRAQLNGPFGLSLRLAASITDGRVMVVPDAGDLQALPGPVRDTVTSALAAPVTLPPLPFNVRLASGRLTPDGLVLDATAENALFPVR